MKKSPVKIFFLQKLVQFVALKRNQFDHDSRKKDKHTLQKWAISKDFKGIW